MRFFRFVLVISSIPMLGVAAAQEDISVRLVSAGFTMRAADTGPKLDRLGTLPPGRFVMRQKAGRPYYLYADPKSCRCVFVGSEKAMNTYRVTMSQAPPGYQDFLGAPTTPSLPGGQIEADMIRDMDHDAGILDADDILHPGF